MITRSLGELRPHPINIKVYGAVGLTPEFLDSVERFGILTPLSILEDGTIVSGHRRWKAAAELGLTEVPVRILSFEDGLAIERAIIESNRQREKTFSQKMREAEELERIEAALAEQRRLANLKRGLESPEVDDRPPREGKTRDKVAEAVGIGSGRQYSRAKKVWEAAKSGDDKAQELVEKLDNEEITVSAASKMIDKKAHVSHASGESEWYTPSKYIEAARATMGEIDCDPASTEFANEIVGAKTYYTIEDNGLEQDWEGRIWMNPPYASPLIKHFSEKLIAELDSGVTEACVLVNNATDTGWFHTLLVRAAAVCFIKGRVKFLDKKGNPTGAPLQGQVVLYFGKNEGVFGERFEEFGEVLHAKR